MGDLKNKSDDKERLNKMLLSHLKMNGVSKNSLMMVSDHVSQMENYLSQIKHKSSDDEVELVKNKKPDAIINVEEVKMEWNRNNVEDVKKSDKKDEIILIGDEKRKKLKKHKKDKKKKKKR